MSAVVFDLDGTLIDSAPDLHAAAVKLLASEGCSPLDLQTVRSFIGNGVPTLVERVIAASDLPDDPPNVTRLIARYLDFYNAASADLTTVYPNVVTTLNRLRSDGHVLGVCTNKPEAPTRFILNAFNLTDLFSAIIGGDSTDQRKPDPTPLNRCFDDLGTTTQRLYVGDSEVDALTATAARVPFCLFTQGYRKSAIHDIAHTKAFSDFGALPDIINTISETQT